MHAGSGEITQFEGHALSMPETIESISAMKTTLREKADVATDSA